MSALGQIPVEHSSSERSWRVDIGDFVVSELSFDSSLMLKPHYHEHACLSIIVEGGMEKEFNNRTFDLSGSSLITIPPGETHEDRFGQRGTRIVVIELDRSISERLPFIEPSAGVLNQVVKQRSPKIGAVAQRLSNELRSPDQFSELAVRGLTYELMLSLARRQSIEEGPTSRHPSWLRRVIEYLHECDDRLITIDEIATEAGLHPGYLSRAFRVYVGIPIGTYARDIRLDRVAAKLITTDDRILDIAIASGFTDQSHLTRLFRSRFGQTPAQYRASLK